MRNQLTAVLIAAVLIFVVQPVQAHDEFPQSLYLTQAENQTCTLCSATMMLRSCVYITGNAFWQQVTEEAVREIAWSSDGMYWNWSYSSGEYAISVAQEGCDGITAVQLRKVLDNHPEGIVLYCGGEAPHAVFLTDYADNAFYCADPAVGYAGERILLEESLLGDRHGSQEQILSAVSAYWYVSDHNLEDQGYLTGCKEYPANCRIRVRWDGDAMSLPSTDSKVGTQRVFRIRSGDYFTVSAFLLNATGEYWYRVGEDIYISAADARCVQEDPCVDNPPKQRRADTAEESRDLVLLLIAEFPHKNTK